MRICKLIIFIGTAYFFSKELGQFIFLPSTYERLCFSTSYWTIFESKSNLIPLKTVMMLHSIEDVLFVDIWEYSRIQEQLAIAPDEMDGKKWLLCCQLFHVPTEIRAAVPWLALFYKCYTLVRIVYKKRAFRYPAEEKIMSFRCGRCRIKLLPSKESVCLYCRRQTYSLKEVTRNGSSSCGESNSGYTVRVIPSLQTIFECVLLWSFVYLGRRSIIINLL